MIEAALGTPFHVDGIMALYAIIMFIWLLAPSEKEYEQKRRKNRRRH